jgi:outer membrane protein assembly factor BamB
MHLVPVTPPAHVQMFSGFDYVTDDAVRHRIFAAHTGSRMLLIVNSDTGAIVNQVEVGPMHGVAVDPATGHVYTGDGESRSVSEVDPVAGTVLRSADIDGNVDAIALDASLHRVYADEDDGTHIFVVDTRTMKEIASIPIPGHKPEYIQVDPETHEVYQNIADLAEVAVVDPQAMKVVRTFSTPILKANHPLQYDAAYKILVIGGKNGMLASYTRDGKLLATASMPPSFDQCNLNPTTHLIACAGSGKVVVLALSAQGVLSHVAELDVDEGAHTLAFDRNTGHIWVVWDSLDGDFIQELKLTP